MRLPIRTIFRNAASTLKFFFDKTEDVPSDNISGFVIDTSISGVPDVTVLLEELAKSIDGSNDKIILTSVVYKELDRLQKRNVENSRNARAILTLANTDKEHYKFVQINSSSDLADDNILRFCEEHRNSVILLTADKTMNIDAEAKSVKTYFFKLPVKPKKVPSKIRTLYNTKRKSEKLYLTTTFDSVSTAYRVRSNGIEYDVKVTRGPKELHIGDDVLVAKNKGYYISLTHFRVISLYENNNCEIIYYKRIYNSKDLQQLKSAFYKSFIKDFKHIRNIP